MTNVAQERESACFGGSIDSIEITGIGQIEPAVEDVRLYLVGGLLLVAYSYLKSSYFPAAARLWSGAPLTALLACFLLHPLFAGCNVWVLHHNTHKGGIDESERFVN